MNQKTVRAVWLITLLSLGAQMPVSADEFDWAYHNKLRHDYASRKDGPREAEQMDILLRHSVMDPYILNIMSGWKLGTDPKAALRNILRWSNSYSKLPSLRAASVLKAGDLYGELGHRDDANRLYNRVIAMPAEGSAAYRALALARLRIVSPQTPERPVLDIAIWLPRDADPAAASCVSAVRQAAVQVRDAYRRLLGQTFKLGRVELLQSKSSEEDLCGGDCSLLGNADKAAYTARDEAAAAGFIAHPKRRAVVVFAYGAGGWAGSWGSPNPLAIIGDWALSDICGFALPPVLPSDPAWAYARGRGRYTLGHELSHSFGGDLETHNDDPFDPSTVTARERRDMLNSPFLWADPSSQSTSSAR